jgi:non-reducing end alpha-L-arabinofuranosidase
MFFRSQGNHWRKAVVSSGASLVLVAGALGISAVPAVAAGTGPCDIYASGGTACVAAHSTTRALYGAYNGSLYQVRRSSDSATSNIGVLSAGGYANAAAQDSFCSGTSCVITIIYDQSGRGNNLTQAPAGGAAGGPDNLANATAAQITLNGNKAYGVYVAAGTGYRNDHTSGIATGDAAEGIYAVLDGTHYNGGCCFDYGNAETNNNDDGNGTMEAIYFGNIKVWGYGTGNGPWVMADLENGLFSGVNAGYNANDATVNFRYTTAIIKGQANNWAIRTGNAQSGGLTTQYNGARPNVSGYNPMKKQGAIILGIGGDNSKGSAGTFYEGVMTSGFPSDATENSVQANIVAAGYGGGTSGGGGSGYIKLQSRADGLYLDGMGRTANGSNVGQWASSGSYNQQWTVVTSGSYVQLQDRATGLFLDTGGLTTNGSNVQQWAGGGSYNQQWTETISGGYAKFQNRATGLFLDTGGLTGNGANVQQWAGGGSYNQQWVVSNA